MHGDVGVIIPTNNRPTETKRALDSVLSQTTPPSEIIIVDDGSDPDLLAQLRELLVGSPVKLIEISATKHPGIARNVGLNQLDTRWVAFLDSDDIWHTTRLEEQLSYAERFHLKAICSNAIITHDLTRSSYLSRIENSYLSLKKLLRTNEIVTSSVLVDRELLQSVGGFATSLSVRGAEDYATWLRIASLNDWYYIGRPLMDYTIASKDSYRVTNEFPQRYIQFFGIIDFQSWLESRNQSHSRLISTYLKGLSLATFLASKKTS
jgi:glycosyltransferase involved in cell wall biosynthesis